VRGERRWKKKKNLEMNPGSILTWPTFPRMDRVKPDDKS
jgi:hypothetical protein